MDGTTKEMMKNASEEISEVCILSDSQDKPFIIGRVHGVGKRDIQQDTLGVSDPEDDMSLRKKGLLTIVADGMGGLLEGDRISRLTVISMLQGFDRIDDVSVPASVLLKLLFDANEAVNRSFSAEDGKGGSTVVAALFNRNHLSFISVGDSRICIYRDGELKQLNRDHNYGTQLDERFRMGEISCDRAAYAKHRRALTSYIGMGKLALVDQNEIPIELHTGDRVLLMTDGVYGTVTEGELLKLLTLSYKEFLYGLYGALQSCNKKKQDNYTCLMVEIR